MGDAEDEEEERVAEVRGFRGVQALLIAWKRET